MVRIIMCMHVRMLFYFSLGSQVSATATDNFCVEIIMGGA